MEPLVAVLDANVLIPAAPRDTLLRAAELGLFRPCWSDQILDEVQRNLVSAARVNGVHARQLIEVLRTAFPDALIAGHEHRVEDLVNAPEDRHVLATAISAGAVVIVTENLADFSAPALAPYDIVALSIDDFLCRLFELDPDGMVMVIHGQAAELTNPPITVEQLMTHLAGWAPIFVRRLRDVSV